MVVCLAGELPPHAHHPYIKSIALHFVLLYGELHLLAPPLEMDKKKLLKNFHECLSFPVQYYQARHAKEMAALLKQAQAKAAAVSQLAFSSQEIFTLDWTNRLLEATWAPALEQILSARLTTTLEVPLTHPVLSPYHWQCNAVSPVVNKSIPFAGCAHKSRPGADKGGAAALP